MTEESQICLELAEEGMQKAISFLERELHKIRAGKASPSMLEGVKIDYYGVLTPLNQMSNINTPDSRSIIIQPWDKNVLDLIEKAILVANLGFNPQNDGAIIRINVPALTEERRIDLVKKAKIEGENAKISIRNVRRTVNDEAKSLEKDGVPEDEVKRVLAEVQEITNSYVTKVDKIIQDKEQSIMTV